MDVAQVLKAISLRTGANIVYASQAKVPVNLSVTVNSTEDAVRSAVAAAGLAYRKVGDVYVVAPSASMRQALEPYSYRVRFTPKSIKAADLAKMLEDELPHATVRAMPDHVVFNGVLDDINQAKKLLAEVDVMPVGGAPLTEIVPLSFITAEEAVKILAATHPTAKVYAFTGSAVTIAGSREVVIAARGLLAQVDRKVPGTGVVFHVYPLRYSSAPAVKLFLEKAFPSIEVVPAPEPYAPPKPRFTPITGGRIGETSSSTNGAGGGGAGQASPQGGAGVQQQQYREGDYATTLVLKGPEADMPAAIRLLEQIDVRPKQVMVEVRVVETSPNFAEQLGFRWSWTRLGFYEAAAGTLIDTGDSSGIGGDFTTFPTKPLGFGQLSRAPFSFQAFLDAQIQQREAKLLANPSMVVLDNNDASIFIGDTIRARIAQAGALGGQTIEVMEFPVGIIMLVRPRINADGMITLRVNPVISTVTALDQNNVPQTSTREAETTLMVRDGETIVIGGLIRDEFSKVVQAVPFLSQLPIIGELFKNRSTSRRRTDIIVTITPRIVDAANPVPPARPATEPDKLPATVGAKKS